MEEEDFKEEDFCSSSSQQQQKSDSAEFTSVLILPLFQFRVEVDAMFNEQYEQNKIVNLALKDLFRRFSLFLSHSLALSPSLSPLNLVLKDLFRRAA